MQIPIYRAVSIFLCHREGRRPVAIRIPKFFRFCKEKRIATPVCALARNDIALFDGLTDKSAFIYVGGAKQPHLARFIASYR